MNLILAFQLEQRSNMSNKTNIIFPSSMENANNVDEVYKKEYVVATEMENFNVFLFDYPEWFFNKKVKLNKKVEQRNQSCIYRGWMFKPDEYRLFYYELANKNLQLLTDPVQYNLMHEFPLIYPKVEKDTPRIKTFDFNEKIDVKKLQKIFSRFLVKDYVKSVKNTAFPKFFDQRTSQADLDNWMKVFYKYRADLLTGGICIKKYVDLKKYVDHTNEWRVFYFEGSPFTILKNSNQTKSTPCVPKELVEKYSNLGSPFYTIDYGEKSNGQWIIIETGDGGVSGLPDQTDVVGFYKKLNQV